MRAYLALVWREIHELRAMLAAAAVASVLPVLAPLLPTSGSNPASDTREAVLWVLVGTLVPLFSLLLGLTFIGRDLAEGRLGFYYAQPLSGPTIWFGKLTAVVLLVWATQIIIMLPTMVLSPDPVHYFAPADWLGSYNPLWYSGGSLWLSPVGIILLSHALGVVWRARSLWLLVDLIALLLLIGGMWMALGPFLPLAAPGVALGGALWMVGWALAGLLVAGAVQVSTGRVDLRRGHRALSMTLWSILLAATVVVSGWGWWIQSATPRDLERLYHVEVGAGDWIAVSGKSSGRLDYWPRFLFNVIDGRWLRIDPDVNWSGWDLQFSADGTRVLWPAYGGIDEWKLMTLNLEAEDPHPKNTGVVLGRHWEDLEISPDGKRASVIEQRNVAVYDLDSGEQLAVVRIDGEYWPVSSAMHDNGNIQILAAAHGIEPGGDRRWRSFGFDADERVLSEGEDLDELGRWFSHVDSMQTRGLLARSEVESEDRLTMLDHSTSEVIADLGPMPHWSDVRVMGDGRVVVTRSMNDEHHMEVFTADGALIHRIELADSGPIFDGGEVAPDRLLVGQRHWSSGEKRSVQGRTSLVDLTTGEAETVLRGFVPVLGSWSTGKSLGAWRVGSVASRLVEGDNGTLHLWDPASGGLRQLIPVAD